MSAVVALPKCIALQSKRNSGSYLRYVHEDGETNNLLQLNGKDAINPYTRFDVEASLLHPGLVHLRCRYNRKYWVPRQRGDSWLILADANEPEEDLTKPNCTLIKPITGVTTRTIDDGGEVEPVMTVWFVHAGQKLGKGVRMCTTSSLQKADDGDNRYSSDTCLRVVIGNKDDGEAEQDDDDGFTVLSLSDSGRILPKFVMFRQAEDSRYLSATTVNNQPFLQFNVGELGDPNIAHEIHNMRNGTFVVRNVGRNLTWYRQTNNWVRPNQASIFAGTKFQLTEVQDLFALRNVHHRGETAYLRFCESYTGDGVRRGLRGAGDHGNITAEARLKVEEAILSREIYNIEYDLRSSRVYATNVLTMATTSAANDTSTVHTKKLRLFYEETETATWDTTLEVKLAYKARIRAGFPKLGLGAQATISAEFFGSFNWGESTEKTVKHEVEYEVAVPPMTKVTVRLLATRSAVDVPFKYLQRDVMLDGTTREAPHEDGMFTGINSYDFHFETVEEQLSERKKGSRRAS